MSKLLNLPDLAFVRYCEQCYPINRGVYNTIEQWFYEHGVHSVQQRRALMLQFFQQLPQHEKCVFGAGGVKRELHHFWETVTPKLRQFA